jgi:hypothetical protein
MGQDAPGRASRVAGPVVPTLSAMTRTWLVLVALGALLATGCGADDGGSAGPREPSAQPRVSAQPGRAEETEQPAGASREKRERQTVRSQEGTQESAPPDPLFVSVDDPHLLPAHVLGARWTVKRTYEERGRFASECQRASLVDIGAMSARLRDFTRRSGPDRAGVAVQAVAEFADRASARRADAVLIAWHDRCVDQLQERGAALGTVRHRAWVSMVEVSGVHAPQRRLDAILGEVRSTFG